MYDEIVSIIGDVPAGLEPFIYLACIAVFIMLCSSIIRLISYVLGGFRHD